MKILTAPQSGSQAGTTASRNRFGQYLRTRAMPVQPRTPKQTFNRALLTGSSSTWRTLSAVTQTAWNDYAAQITRSDSLGQNYQPTGAELFVAAVVCSGSSGFASDPPSVLPTYVLQVSSVAYVDPTPGPEALNVGIVVTSANNLVKIETSGPISGGITSAAAVRRWFSLPDGAANLQALQFPMSASPIDAITAYKRLFPSPVTGNNIWFRFTEIFFDGSSAAGVTNTLKQTYRLVVP